MVTETRMFSRWWVAGVLLLLFDRDEVESPAGAAAAVIGAVMGAPLSVAAPLQSVWRVR